MRFPHVFACYWIGVWLIGIAVLQPAKALTVSPSVPLIPHKTFNIINAGAVPDGQTINTQAIQRAIDEAAHNGGGIVLIPKGNFFCGPLVFKSNIDLHFEKGAVLTMSPHFTDFPTAGKTYADFLTAANVHDIQISGEGTIDGQGKDWWTAFRAKQLQFRRPQMIRISKCERVKLSDFSTLNPPNTHCSIADSNDVTIEGLTMTAPGNSPNTDALNLRGKNMVVKNCKIATGDDNIVLLASGESSPGNPAVENVQISHCELGVGHGLSIGSYTSGGIRNIVAEDIHFNGTTSGIRLKAARDRGGLTENVTYRNITMENVRFPIYLTSYYPKEPQNPKDDVDCSVGPLTPIWRNIIIENVVSTNSKNSIVLWGVPGKTISGVELKNISIASETGATIYNADGVRFENTTISAQKGPPLTTFNSNVEGMDAVPLSSAK